MCLGFPWGWVGKEPACNTKDGRDMGLIPGSGRSPGGGHSNSLQYSCLENPMDRGAQWTTVHRSQRVRHDWSDLAQHSTLCVKHWIKPRNLMVEEKLAWSLPSCNVLFVKLQKSYELAKISNISEESKSVSHSVVFDSLQPHGLSPTRLLCPWNFPGKNIGLGSHSLLQGIFLTPRSNRGLLHYRQIFLLSEPPEMPKDWHNY